MKVKYDIVASPLSDDDGGGYLAFVPDLKGCMSDGDSIVEAVENVQDAITAWIEINEKNGRPIPEPGALREMMVELDNETSGLIDDQSDLIEKQRDLISALAKRVEELEKSQKGMARIHSRSVVWGGSTALHDRRVETKGRRVVTGDKNDLVAG